MDWGAELPLLRALADGLEEGVAVVDENGRIVFASEPMAAMLGLGRAALSGLAVDELLNIISAGIDTPPAVVREGRLMPTREYPLVCEEFEMIRPSRSVLRWVARWTAEPRAIQIIMITDITAQVDLTAAYQRLAMTDGLTGLANRRHAEQTLRREIARSQRYGNKVSVAILDVDHFKRINDNHGHALGDEVLMSVARLIGRTVRESDFAARWGGEEFLLVMADTDMEGALNCCERVRATIADQVVCGGKPVTVSIGVATHKGAEAIDATLARADLKLYEAKNAGRNRLAA